MEEQQSLIDIHKELFDDLNSIKKGLGEKQDIYVPHNPQPAIDDINKKYDGMAGDLLLKYGGDDDGGKKPLPKPDFNNPNSVRQYRNALSKKYSALHQREDLPEYLNTSYENEPTPIKDIVSKYAPKAGLRPELLYTSAMEEGLRGLFPNSKNKGEIDYSGDEKYPISGFANLGLDRFSDAYPELVKRGYLDPSFKDKFNKSIETLPSKESTPGAKVNSANFKDMESAIAAKSAMVKMMSDNIDNWANKSKIPLSDKQKEFFHLIAYNAGESNAQKMIQSYRDKGYLKDDKFIEKQPDSSWSGPYANIQKRILAANALKAEKYF